VKTVYSGGTTDPVNIDDGFNTLFGYGDSIQFNTRYNFQQATEYGQDVDKIYMISSGYYVPYTCLVLVKKTDGTFHTMGRNTSNNLRGIIPFNSDLTVNEYQLVPNAFLNTYEPHEIKTFAMSTTYGVILLKNGEVWAWGDTPFVSNTDNVTSLIDVTSRFYEISYDNGLNITDLRNTGWYIENILGLSYQCIVHLKNPNGEEKLCLIGTDTLQSNFSGYNTSTIEYNYTFLVQNNEINSLLINSTIQDLQGHAFSFKFKVNGLWYGFTFLYEQEKQYFTHEWMGTSDYNSPLKELELLNSFLSNNPNAVRVESFGEKTAFYVGDELWLMASFSSIGEYGTQDNEPLTVFTKVDGMTLNTGTDLSNVSGTFSEFLIHESYGLFITTSSVFDTDSITTPVAPNKNIYFMKSPNNTGQLRIKSNNA
jgi:hypothetical protein